MLSDPNKVNLRIEYAESKLRIIANGKVLCENVQITGMSADLGFAVFNATDADADKKITLRGITVSAHSAADVYGLKSDVAYLNILSAATENEGKANAAVIPVTVIKNNAAAALPEGYTLDYAIDESDYIMLDTATNKVYAVGVGALDMEQAYVSVLLKKDGAEVACEKILVQVSPLSNDSVTVKGGVVLGNAASENYTLTFPESMMNVNGVGNDNRYVDNAYSADFKQTVKGDFSVEFTVASYKYQGDYPKLMISLGGTNNQFYVVYGRLGHINHIETFVYATSESDHDAGGWVSSDEFGSDFDVNAEHTYKITCVGGVYHVYLDGAELRFSFDSDNESHSTATLYRNVTDWQKELPVRISTNGVSAVVKNIKITDAVDGEQAVTLPDFYSYDAEHTGLTDTGFTMKLTKQSVRNNNSANDEWAIRDAMFHKVTYLEPVNTDTQISFDIDFNERMKDGKLVMKLGRWEYHFCDKTGDNLGLSFQLFPGGWGEPNTRVFDTAKKLHIVFERKDGAVWLYINGERLLNGKTGADVSTMLEFYIFGGADDIGKTVTLSEFAEKQYDAATRFEYFGMTIAETTLSVKPGATATVEPTATCNDVALDAAAMTAKGLSFEYAIAGNTHITLDGNTLSAAAALVGTETATVTVTLKKGDDILRTATVTVIATAKATENSIVKAKGGVVFDYTGDDPEANWSVTFPQNLATTDGVVNEHAYAEADYSADLKTKVKGDTTIEFTVANYSAAGASPKLMVSLGSQHNQFYFVYTEADGFRLEVVVPRVNIGYGIWEDNGWLTSAWDKTFDPAALNTFKIELKSGIYRVYRKTATAEYQELIVGENGSIGSHTMGTSFASYTSEKSARISTKNASCTVSDIKLTTGTVAKYFYTTALVSGTDDAIVLKANKDSWGAEASNKDWVDHNQARYTGTFASNQTAEFDIAFDTAMSDGKFAMNVGTNNYYIENKLGSENKINLCGNGDWENRPLTPTAVDGVYSAHVRIVRNGAAVAITVTCGDASVTFENSTDAASDRLYFWMFNENQEQANATVTVTNLTITNNQ